MGRFPPQGIAVKRNPHKIFLLRKYFQRRKSRPYNQRKSWEELVRVERPQADEGLQGGIDLQWKVNYC